MVATKLRVIAWTQRRCFRGPQFTPAAPLVLSRTGSSGVPATRQISARGFNAGRAIPFNPPGRNGELTVRIQPEIPDLHRARMSLRMLDRVPVIDDALHGFDHILEALGFRIVRPERCFGLPDERLFPVFRRRRPEVVAGLGERRSVENIEGLQKVAYTIGDYEVVPRPMVPAFTLSDEAGLQATAGYLQRERCLSQLGNMRCAR
jgi:hypothetical protein